MKLWLNPKKLPKNLVKCLKNYNNNPNQNPPPLGAVWYAVIFSNKILGNLFKVMRYSYILDYNVWLGSAVLNKISKNVRLYRLVKHKHVI